MFKKFIPTDTGFHKSQNVRTVTLYKTYHFILVPGPQLIIWSCDHHANTTFNLIYQEQIVECPNWTIT